MFKPAHVDSEKRKQDWQDFCAATKRLGKSLSYFYTPPEPLAKIYAKRYPGDTGFDYTQSAPRFNDIEDANEFIERLWKDHQKRFKRLQEQDSTNSSRPPSSDTLSSKCKRQEANRGEPSGRKRGAQPGHVGKGRALLPTEQVDEVIVCLIACSCSDCQLPLPTPKMTGRKQVFSLASKRLTVTEYQLQKDRALFCL